MKDLDRFLARMETTIREAMVLISRNAEGVALVVDDKRQLLGVVTDGDIRRAILAAVDLGKSVRVLLDRKVGTWAEHPTTARQGVDAASLVELMQSRKLQHVPIVDDENRVVDLILLRDFVGDGELPVRAVVMAGGYGRRLHPLTEDTPKPMLAVGDRPLLEHIVDNMKGAGIRRVQITTHFRADDIKEHFGDGSRFGLDVEYITEDQPLGTAGALGLMERPSEPVLVMNGDVLTQVDFRAMLAYHHEHEADMTVGVRQYDVQVPFGVVKTEDTRVVGIEEKPLVKFFVNAGVYLLEPAVFDFVPRGARLDMTDLIAILLGEARQIVSFPISEYWLDIGRHDDYQKAQADIRSPDLSGRNESHGLER
ncbi:MAG: nucleotidyltransferase family protein [Kiritimatiellae bacterium]|nr:nucleotidyltransferase family protein [Kiritimatiellia bacterium]